MNQRFLCLHNIKKSANYGAGESYYGNLGFWCVVISLFSAFYINKPLENTNWRKFFNVDVDIGFTVFEANENLISYSWSFHSEDALTMIQAIKV